MRFNKLNKSYNNLGVKHYNIIQFPSPVNSHNNLINYLVAN